MHGKGEGRQTNICRQRMTEATLLGSQDDQNGEGLSVKDKMTKDEGVDSPGPTRKKGGKIPQLRPKRRRHELTRIRAKYPPKAEKKEVK